MPGGLKTSRGLQALQPSQDLKLSCPYGHGMNASCAAPAEDQATGMDPTAIPCENLSSA